MRERNYIRPESAGSQRTRPLTQAIVDVWSAWARGGFALGGLVPKSMQCWAIVYNEYYFGKVSDKPPPMTTTPPISARALASCGVS